MFTPEYVHFFERIIGERELVEMMLFLTLLISFVKHTFRLRDCEFLF